MQKHSPDEHWRPVAYASRTLSTAEQRYAQIEREALAICWGCEKFNYHLVGCEFVVETDHKPLVSVLGSKELAKLPLRVQRFRLRLMAYSYKIMYTPGEKLVLADALSRAPVCDGSSEPTESGSDDSNVAVALAEEVSISQHRLARIRAALLEEEQGVLLLKYITEGWPLFKQLHDGMRGFYTFKECLTVVDDAVYYLNRVYIPAIERDKSP